MIYRLLDLFCGAGGCGVGYARAGFEVVGVDIEDHPDYPFEFHQADAMAFPLDGFDVIHASPPCQAFSDMQFMHNAGEHHDLLTPTRERLRASGVPWVIENVEGSPLNAGPPSLFSDTSGVVLCGSMFDLVTDTYALRRHRLFESNVVLPQPRCRHRSDRVTVGFYGDHARIRARVEGHKDRGQDILGAEKMQLVKSLMGIDWMVWDDARQAVPPAFTEWIGGHLLNHLAGIAA